MIGGLGLARGAEVSSEGVTSIVCQAVAAEEILFEGRVEACGAPMTTRSSN